MTNTGNTAGNVSNIYLIQLLCLRLESVHVKGHLTILLLQLLNSTDTKSLMSACISIVWHTVS